MKQVVIMDKIVEFKDFVKQHPKLINFVKKGDMSWQKFYEMYDLYGDDKEVWKDYLEPVKVATATTSAFGISDFMNWIKNIDLNKMQEGINSVQRVVGVLQDFGGKEDTIKPEYKPRPLYKHFED